MVEFIVDSYWIDKPPQFKDVKDRFKTLSDGSIANYLDELIAEKKIRKLRNENKVYYGPPKIHPAVKLSIIAVLGCAVATVLLFILWQPVFSLLFFAAGVVFTCFFWRFSARKNRNFK